MDEKHEAEERSSPTGEVVYEAVHAEGENELARSSGALAWSGLAAGLSMSFTFIAVSLLHAHTPHAKWQTLVAALGYPLGFVIVVLGRQQLFTENTLTAVLPLLGRPTAATLTNVLRLWLIVLAANTAGAIAIAFVLARTEAVDHATYEAMSEVAQKVYSGSFAVTLLRAIFGGWLIALMVWLLPFAETARVAVIALLTYLVGAAHFAHIVAGSVDASFLVFTGERTWLDFTLGFFVPALIGNVIGGVLLVAAINHAQVKSGTPVHRA